MVVANYTMTIAEMMNNELTQNIFPTNYEFYIDDSQARKAFEDKFINHFYYREIAFESPFIFKQRLNALLLLRMPYWKKLYETELEAKDINFLLNKDLKETFIRELNSENKSSGTNSSNQSSSSSNTVNQTTSSSNMHKESSLMDGVSSVSLEDGYLTGIGSDSGENTTSGNSNGTDTIEASGSSSQTGNETTRETTELLSQGNIGITSSAELLEKWRSVLINMDEIIINECNELFMKLY